MALVLSANRSFPFIHVKEISRNLDMLGITSWQEKHGAIQPTNFAAQLKKFRGSVFTCARINASAVADAPWNLYVSKKKRERKYGYVETLPISKAQLKYIHGQNFCQRYRRKGEEIEEIADHPMLDLLQQVNPFMNGYDLIELTVLFMELTGNAYWYLNNADIGGQSIPQEIWIMQPQWMKPVPDKQKGISKYIYKRGTEEIHFEEDEIIHFYCPSPLHEWYGIGAIMGAIEAQSIWESMYDYDIAMLENLSRPDIVVMVKQSLTEEQKRRLSTTMKKSFGKKKTGTPMVASEQVISDIKPIGADKPREMGFPESRKYVREEIFAAMRVPVSYATMESSNRAVAETGIYQHSMFAVKPYCTRIDQKLSEKLCPRYDEHIFVLHDNPVPRDRELRLKETQAWLKSGMVTRNEAREYNEFDTLEDGDVFLPQGNIVPSPLDGMDEDEIREMVSQVLSRAKEMWN